MLLAVHFLCPADWARARVRVRVRKNERESIIDMALERRKDVRVRRNERERIIDMALERRKEGGLFPVKYAPLPPQGLQ
jgi:hypothetical protein